ncbi:MAG: hypothetical protein IJX53_08310 [Clostridia bacterium]|nr:hypothetical protein [Clostridia bacterium]
MHSLDLQYITDIFWKAVNENDQAWSSKTKIYQKMLDKQMANIVKSITQVEA